ncbi:hypothetical protein HPB49_006553 [Dermacentor silvarum]|uniref:Uncharacterized protein n=1 Tax=Dermacentor silvarum TaxID=543639 RepID=A0ACB8DWH4_DERSI|nr:hypothetical protein HPB49_006553 [Dermacentor silvarum]
MRSEDFVMNGSGIKNLKHADSKKHKDYVVPAPQQLKQFLAQVSKPNFDQARREVRIALFTATHTPVSAVDELGEILQEEFDGKFRMHRTKCAAVIKNVLAPHFKHKLDKMVKEAPGYSLMLDESTDVSTTKQLCVSVRFHNSETNCISDTFLDLKEVANGTAEVMHQCVMDILSDHGLSLKDCVGIATDGANSMCGEHNSLWSRLREGHPDLILVKCMCHSLDLVAAKSMQTMPSALEYMVRESHNYFAHSSTRLAAYKGLYNSMLEDTDKVEPPKLLSLSPTRWLAMFDCIERILGQFESLQKFFHSIDSRNYSTRVLRDMYNDTRNHVYLIFLAAVLHNVKRVNLLFQSQTADPLKLFQELENLYIDVLKRILKPAVLRHNSNSDLLSLDLKNMESIYLDCGQADLGAAFAERLAASGLPAHDQTCIRERCFNFLQKLATELQTRIPNATSALRRLQAISPETVLGPNACREILSLPSCLFGIRNNQLEAEVRLLRSAFATTETSSATSFWYEALAFRDAAGVRPFPALAAGAIRILTLPVSNAEAERVFSNVTLTKTELRNKMKMDLLESILRIKFGLRLKKKTSSNYIVPEEVLCKMTANYSGACSIYN